MDNIHETTTTQLYINLKVNLYYSFKRGTIHVQTNIFIVNKIYLYVYKEVHTIVLVYNSITKQLQKNVKEERVVQRENNYIRRSMFLL